MTVDKAWRRRFIWAVPVLTAGVVVAGAVAITPASSAPNPKLPVRSAQQLLTAVASSDTASLEGTVTETAKLGLPSLPGGTQGASLSWQSLLTGSQTAHVWIAGPDKQRIALKGQLSEADIVRNASNLWTYTSQTNEVSHTVLKAGAAGKQADARPDEVALTPTSAARKVLASIDPSTRVTVDRTRWVAGRKAYTLVLTPRDARSTVHKVTIAIDSVHSVPLQVQVFGAGKAPAFETGFTAISFASPKASVFDFTIPRGATVVAGPSATKQDAAATTKRPAAARQPLAEPTTIGTGWTTILEVPAGSATKADKSMLQNLTVPVGTTGNRLLKTALVNALVTKNGRVFVGAVSPALLEKAAATHR